MLDYKWHISSKYKGDLVLKVCYSKWSVSSYSPTLLEHASFDSFFMWNLGFLYHYDDLGCWGSFLVISYGGSRVFEVQSTELHVSKNFFWGEI